MAGTPKQASSGDEIGAYHAETQPLLEKRVVRYMDNDFEIDVAHCPCQTTHTSSILDDLRVQDSSSCVVDSLAISWQHSVEFDLDHKSTTFKRGMLKSRLSERFQLAFGTSLDLRCGCLAVYGNEYVRVWRKHPRRQGYWLITDSGNDKWVHAQHLWYFRDVFKCLPAGVVIKPQQLEVAVSRFVNDQSIPNVNILMVILVLLDLPVKMHRSDGCQQFGPRNRRPEMHIYVDNGHSVPVDHDVNMVTIDDVPGVYSKKTAEDIRKQVESIRADEEKETEKIREVMAELALAVFQAGAAGLAMVLADFMAREEHLFGPATAMQIQTVSAEICLVALERRREVLRQLEQGARDAKINDISFPETQQFSSSETSTMQFGIPTGP